MVFDKLRDGIVYFLKHDPYLVASNKARMDDLKEKIEMIDREILKLDSLQNTMYFREGNMPNLQLGINRARICFCCVGICREPFLFQRGAHSSGSRACCV